MSARWWILGSAAWWVGCASAHTEPRAVAAREQGECRDVSTMASTVALDGALVDRVEPLLAHVHSFQLGGPEPRLIGARLHIRPVEGVTTASLNQALLCHEVREVLSTPTMSDDPYSLPNEWVDIRVEPEGLGYLVTTEGQAPSHGKALLERATLFAERRRAAPALP
jgi:hypothetical protein